MWLLLLGTRPLGLHAALPALAAPWPPLLLAAPLWLVLPAHPLLPNALCYFLIITQVTCKWKVKGLPRRRRRGRPHPVSGSGCGQDTNRRRTQDEGWSTRSWRRHEFPPFYFSATASIFFVAVCNDAGKFAGNNFNCVNCAVFLPRLLRTVSLSLSLYLSIYLCL